MPRHSRGVGRAGFEGPDREGVPKIVQARPARTERAADAERTGETNEDAVHARLGRGSPMLDHEQVIASCAEAIASGEVAAERRARARMQRHQAALTELA